MNYIDSILWLLSWPVVIFISYKLAVVFVKRLEKKLE